MTDFLRQMLEGPRIIAVTGHFGSGKTEFAVSLAFALAGLMKEQPVPTGLMKEQPAPTGLMKEQPVPTGLMKERPAPADSSEERPAPSGPARESSALSQPGREHLALADLDIENPYFRSRERKESLEEQGIRVYSDPYGGRNGSELQTLDSAIRAPLEDPLCRVICDTGGDFTGAMVLNQFRKYFQEDYQLLCMVNCNRPGTDTVEKALYHVRSIEETTGLKVTGLISNAHFVRHTTAQDVAEGLRFTQEAAQKCGIPALCACCMEELAPECAGLGCDIFPIGMYMRESYLDKQV